MVGESNWDRKLKAGFDELSPGGRGEEQVILGEENG